MALPCQGCEQIAWLKPNKNPTAGIMDHLPSVPYSTFTESSAQWGGCFFRMFLQDVFLFWGKSQALSAGICGEFMCVFFFVGIGDGIYGTSTKDLELRWRVLGKSTNSLVSFRIFN